MQEHGYNVPPITDTTRSVLIKKLNQLDQQRRQDQRQATPRKQGQNKDIKIMGQGCNSVEGVYWRDPRFFIVVLCWLHLPPPFPNPAACFAGGSIVQATWSGTMKGERLRYVRNVRSWLGKWWGWGKRTTAKTGFPFRIRKIRSRTYAFGPSRSGHIGSYLYGSESRPFHNKPA